MGDEEEIGAEMAPEPVADEGRMIAVDDFLAALENALETAMGDEVEIDSDEMSDEAPEDEMAPEAEDEFAPEGEEVVADAEMEDEMLEETGAEDTGASEDDDSKTHAGKKDYEKNESAEASDDLVEQITKRVAARILKTALNKK